MNPIKVLQDFHTARRGDVILPSDGRYKDFLLWAKRGDIANRSLICEFLELIETPHIPTSEELMELIDNDNDKLEAYCIDNDIEIPEDHRWVDRYETIAKALEDKE